MRYRVLGSVTATVDGEPAALGGPKARALLALLLVDAGRVVTDRRLIAGIWGDDAPDGAHHAIQNHVSRLRRAIDDEIVRDGGGYRLDVDPMAVDAHRFGGLAAAGRDRLADAPAAAATLLRDALALWHGEPYADLGDVPGLRADVRRLDAARLEAVEDRMQADLECGRHADVVAELEGLIREHPFRERLYGMYMLALYRAGRQAEALDVFHRAREALADELGIDPSPELAELHTGILTHDPALQIDQSRATAADSVGTETTTGSLPVVGGFELREHVGEGDFGRTYRAYHAALGREVALKILRDELSDLPDVVRGFDRRAQRVAQLDHPHVMPLLDYWRDPGAAYLVTPWAPAGSVHDALRHGPWTPTAALRMLEQVGAALELAHRRGVVHGDVKTTNIILSGDGDARLTDFPVARRLRDAHGTPRTNNLGAIAPEERRGAPSSIAGDVYSLGAVAIEVLTGAKPAAKQPATVLAQRADVPDEIIEALAAATAADPAQRPARVVDMLRRLRRTLGADVVAPAGVSDDTLAAVRNPYKGLHAFTEDDAVDFFGRESVVSRLLRAVDAHHLVAVVGPSGSGKSSIVRAGAIPALRAGALRGSERWLITGMYPGSHPFDELSVALRRVAVDPPDNLVAALTVDDRGLARLVKQILPGDDAQLLLVIDQFEELFSLTSDPAVRQLFLDSLVALADDARGRVRTIVTLRADFFDRPLEHHGLGELLRDGLVSVPVPSRDELAQAVSAPARQVGVEFEPGLIGRIVDEVVDQPGGLPLMQYALTELFTRRSGRTLTERAYEDTGGVRGALGRRAEELYTALSATHQDLAQQIFLRLVTVDEHAGETRRRARRSELIGLSDDRSAVDEVLQRFGAHRLVTFDRDPVTRGATVEVAHEASLTEWGRLRRWVDDRRDDLLQHRRLTLDAAEWRRADRANDFLLTGGRLEQLARFAETTDLALDRDEREFLAASTEHDGAVRRRRRRQRRLVTVALAAVALLTAALVGFGLVQRGRDTVRGQMEHAAALAAASRSVQTTDADLALLLAREAIRTTRAAGQPPTSDALGALHEAVLAHRVVATIDTDTSAVAFLDDERLITPSSDARGPTVWNVASGTAERTFDQVDIEPGGREPDFGVSPDGRRYAEAYVGDTPTTVWDVATGEVLHRMPPRRDARAWPAFDDAGAILAVSHYGFDDEDLDEVVSVYEVASGEERHRFPIPGSVGRYAVSPDGRMLAVPRVDAPLVHLFDLETGEQLANLEGRADWHTVGSVAFHPDDETLAVLYQEGRLRLYELPSRTVIGSARIDTDTAISLCYSADGSTLAVTSQNKAIDILTPDAATLLTRVPDAAIASPASCSPDVTTIAAGTVTGRAKVWNVTPSAGSEIWSAAAPAPWTAAWVGDAVVTMHDDRRLRRYEPGRGLTATSGIATMDVEYPPPFATHADSLIATFPRAEFENDDDAPGFTDGVVLRDARTLQVTRKTPLTGYPQAFDRDGARLLVSKQASVHIIDTATGMPTGTLDASYSRSSHPIAAFLSDGRHVVVDDAYRTYVFDLDTGDIVATVCVQAVGFRVVTSRGGSLFAVDGERGVEVYDADRLLDAAADAGPVRIDDVSPALECANGNPAADVRIAFLEGVDVRFMAFSPDGTRLAVVSENGNVSMWDPRTGELEFTIPHDGEVGGGTFSDDGRHLAVTVDDPDRDADTVRIYTLDVDELLDIADAKVTRELTPEECAGYRIADPCGPAT